MYVHVHAANWRASCAPPFGLFLHTLAAPQGAPFRRHPAAEATAWFALMITSARGHLNSRVPVLLRNHGDPSPRLFGLIRVNPAMLGTANGAGWCTNPCIPALRRSDRWLLEKPDAGERSVSCCFCFCGRMPPKQGPLWRGEGAQEKPEGWRAGCAPVRCMHMDVHSANPVAHSRTRRAGCPESAPPGVCFFGYFLCTSKESNPLAQRASGSSALE